MKATLLLLCCLNFAWASDDCSPCMAGISAIMDIHKEDNKVIRMDSKFFHKLLCPTNPEFSFCENDEIVFWENAAWEDNLYEEFCQSIDDCTSGFVF